MALLDLLFGVGMRDQCSSHGGQFAKARGADLLMFRAFHRSKQTQISSSSLRTTVTTKLVMADIAAPQPISEAMQGVEGTLAALTEASAAAIPTPPEEPDNACETLYIQNLNEKIKTDGKSPFAIYQFSKNTDSFSGISAEGIVTRFIQVIWGGSGCGCT
jgi:hypothetical protein